MKRYLQLDNTKINKKNFYMRAQKGADGWLYIIDI